MSLTITPITPKTIDQVDIAHAAIESGFEPELQCASSGPSVPDLGWLRACVLEVLPRHEVSVVREGAEIVALVVVHLPDSRVSWMCLNRSEHAVDEIFTVVAKFCTKRYGMAWGYVGNENLHGHLDTAGFTHLEAIVEWKSPHTKAGLT